MTSYKLEYALNSIMPTRFLQVSQTLNSKNSLAHSKMRASQSANSLTLLGQLHWLPIEFRIRFILVCLITKSLQFYVCVLESATGDLASYLSNVAN